MTVRDREHSQGRPSRVELVEMMAVIFRSQGQETERQDGRRIVPSVATAVAIFKTSEIDCARARGLLKA